MKLNHSNNIPLRDLGNNSIFLIAYSVSYPLVKKKKSLRQALCSPGPNPEVVFSEDVSWRVNFREHPISKMPREK